MFRDRIKKAYDSLTPSFRRLGEFILNNELDVAFMTATELAHALDVDAATVVRFSQALGYRGYRELSKEVQQIVKADLTAAYATFDDAKTDVARLQALLENERHNLEVAVAQVTDQAAEMVAILARAQRLWIVGEAGASCMASFFASYLRMAGVKAIAVDASPSEAVRALWDLGEKDVVLGLGMTGSGIDTAAALSFAKTKGAKTASVSVSSVSPPARVAEHTLVCPSNSPLGIASASSLLTMLMVLWQAVLARDTKKIDARLKGLQDAYAALAKEQAAKTKQADISQLWRAF